MNGSWLHAGNQFSAWLLSRCSVVAACAVPVIQWPVYPVTGFQCIQKAVAPYTEISPWGVSGKGGGITGMVSVCGISRLTALAVACSACLRNLSVKRRQAKRGRIHLLQYRCVAVHVGLSVLISLLIFHAELRQHLRISCTPVLMIFRVSTVLFRAWPALRFWRSPGPATTTDAWISPCGNQKESNTQRGPELHADRLRVVTENAVRLSGSSSRRPFHRNIQFPAGLSECCCDFLYSGHSHDTWLPI